MNRSPFEYFYRRCWNTKYTHQSAEENELELNRILNSRFWIGMIRFRNTKLIIKHLIKPRTHFSLDKSLILKPLFNINIYIYFFWNIVYKISRKSQDTFREFTEEPKNRSVEPYKNTTRKICGIDHSILSISSHDETLQNPFKT